jgi:hypothetical protein
MAKSTLNGTLPTKPPETEVESGVDANLPFSMPFYVDKDSTGKSTPNDLMEVGPAFEDGPSIQQLVSMRKMDGQARALYRLLTLPIRSSLRDASIKPEEGGDAEAQFINDVFFTPAEAGGMTVTFQRFMAQLLQGMFDGFSSFEKVFWVPKYGPLKGKITLRKLAYRPANTVTFITDDKGGFRGIRQQTYIGGKAIDTYIPREYSFYWAAQEEERKFYGTSYFQTAYYHYDKKIKLYYVAHLAAQRAAVGTRVGTYPQGATVDKRRTFSSQLANLSVAQWLTMPEGYKVDLLKEGGTFDFLNLINHHNSQMSKSILAQFFDQAQGSGSNDSAVVNFAAPGNEMFILMLRAVMDEIANQINHYIIPQLIAFNFKSTKFPKFTWGKLTDEQRAAITALFSKVVTAGQSSLLPPEFLRELEKQQAKDMGLEVDWDEVEQREEEEAAQAQAAMMPQPGMPPEGVPPEGAPPPEGGVVSEDQSQLIEDFEKKVKNLKPSDGQINLTAQEKSSIALLTLAREFLDVAGQSPDE